MYQRLPHDPSPVDSAWHEFFADYRPADEKTSPGGNGAQARPAARSATTVAPPPAPSAEPAEPSERRRLGARKAMPPPATAKSSPNGVATKGSAATSSPTKSTPPTKA